MAAEEYPPGTSVVIAGLTSEAGQQLNGRKGVVKGWDESSGRVKVPSRLDRDSLRDHSSLHILLSDLIRFDTHELCNCLTIK